MLLPVRRRHKGRGLSHGGRVVPPAGDRSPAGIAKIEFIPHAMNLPSPRPVRFQHAQPARMEAAAAPPAQTWRPASRYVVAPWAVPGACRVTDTRSPTSTTRGWPHRPRRAARRGLSTPGMPTLAAVAAPGSARPVERRAGTAVRESRGARACAGARPSRR